MISHEPGSRNTVSVIASCDFETAFVIILAEMWSCANAAIFLVVEDGAL